MTKDYDKREFEKTVSESLEELLKGVSDDVERDRLTRAWNALGGLVCGQDVAPRPSSELDALFRGIDEQLSDNELEMLAAAGTQAGPVNGEGAGHSHGVGSGNVDQVNGRDDDTVSDWFGEVEDNPLAKDSAGPASCPDEDWGDDVLARDPVAPNSDMEEDGDVYVFGHTGGRHEIEDFSPRPGSLPVRRRRCRRPCR